MIASPMASAAQTRRRGSSLIATDFVSRDLSGGPSGAGLAEVTAIRVVIEVEAKRQVLSAKFAGQGWERIGRGDTAPRRAIERNVSRRRHQPHTLHAAVLHDGELDGDFAFLHEGSAGDFRNQVVPVLANIMQHSGQVRPKVDPHGVTEDFHAALDLALAADAGAVIAAGTAAESAPCRR